MTSIILLFPVACNRGKIHLHTKIEEYSPRILKMCAPPRNQWQDMMVFAPIYGDPKAATTTSLLLELGFYNLTLGRI